MTMRPIPPITVVEMFGHYDPRLDYRLKKARELYQVEMRSRPKHPLNDRISVSRFPIPLVVHVMDTRDAPGRYGHSGIHVRVAMIVSDRETGEPVSVSAEGFASHDMTERELLQFIHYQVTLAIKHELDECFFVDDKRLYEPHPEPKKPEIAGHRLDMIIVDDPIKPR